MKSTIAGEETTMPGGREGTEMLKLWVPKRRPWDVNQWKREWRGARKRRVLPRRGRVSEGIGRGVP
jgi:hypothetical protein